MNMNPTAAVLEPEFDPSAAAEGEQLTLREIRSIDELLASADLWDDLWQRSDVTLPTARAALVAAWHRHFAPQAAFCAVVVECGGRFVAALPLVERRVKRLFRAAALPANEWGSYGTLLVDGKTHHADSDAVLDVLTSGLTRLGWPLLWLEGVAFEAPHWQAFRAAAERAGMFVDVHEQARIGQVEIGDDWESYFDSLKGDHRRTRRRNAKMIDKAGGAELVVMRDLAPEQVADAVRRGFEVEDRSWKGTAGTSVLKTPGMLDFYTEVAGGLARNGHLELTFLEHGGGPIAFDFGWTAKGVHYIAKLGYDEQFRQFGPGHQLAMRVIESMHVDGSHHLLDFAGPLVPWTESWSTRSYPVGRMAVATQYTTLAKGIFRLYDRYGRRRAAHA